MRVLLIPSATLIPKEMRSRMGTIPTCLFPLGNSTMLERICDQYHGIVDEVYVVVNQEQEQVRNYVILKKLPVKLIVTSELRTLGYSVCCGLEAIDCEKIEQLYINFADTLISNQLTGGPRDIVYYEKETISEDWTFFQQRDGKIQEVIDKQVPDREEREICQGDAFVGAFELSCPQQFLEDLRYALREEQQEDAFYRALQQYSQKIQMEYILANCWFDVGHSVRYIQAKTSVEARSFNTIDIDENRGILKKQSENQNKLIDEIQWYLRLPMKLQYLIPRIYDYSLERTAPYVSMEYYGYTTMHEMLVYGDLPEQKWRKYFEKIRFALDDMGRFKVDAEEKSKRSSMEEIYITKTISRLNSLRKDQRFSAFFQDVITVNGLRYPCLNQCIEVLPGILRRRLIDGPTKEFSIIHGDLCFSNILVEDRFGFMRIIDPRGRFGEFDIYGDQRYELAKLMHSLDGQYDFIIKDLFSVQVDGTRIQLEISTQAKAIYGIFQDVFGDLLHDYENLQLIESTLFLSMIPFHSNVLSRQYAMLATGLRLLSESIGGMLHE